MSRTFDFAVIGSGVFGSWTAHTLRRSGSSVVLLDAYGPGGNRASSGGETRVIRMGYGADELYTRWSQRALPLWKEFASRVSMELFHATGVLWLTNESDSYTQSLWQVIGAAGVRAEKLDADEIRKRWPQLRMPDVTWGVFEPESGLLMARRAVQAVLRDAVSNGVEYRTAAVLPPHGRGKLTELQTLGGEPVSAGNFIFACGPWLPKLFPQLLGGRIFPTRQEVFFLGPPAGSLDYRPPRMPVWLHHTHPALPYALPDIENRGFKIAFDRHGPEFDPDTGARVVSQSSLDLLREYLQSHLPALADAPVVETRVCQYENTSNGDFLIDRHPDFENVWLVGGGSGHGFKHGPVVGEYVTNLLLHNAPAEPRFSLAGKQTVKARAVY